MQKNLALFLSKLKIDDGQKKNLYKKRNKNRQKNFCSVPQDLPWSFGIRPKIL